MSDCWYKDGLRFGCTSCGKCCTGSPGYVWVDENEITALAEFLQISKEQFIKQYTRQVGARLSLREHPRNYDCVFLKEKKCSVYDARPKQCRKFPWWPEHLNTPQAWNETSLRCEGINHRDAPLVSLEDIQKHLD